MKLSVILLSMLVVFPAFALDLAKLKIIEKQFKGENVRTIIKKPDANSGFSFCTGAYVIELQIKSAKFNHITKETSESWQTVKTLNVSEDGNTWLNCDE